MIITRTPFRISFFGGGTDYPAWFKEHGGAVIGTTINKYCYLSVRRLPPFFEHRHRVVYSKIELPNSISDIQHPSVKSVLSEHWDDENGLEIHHHADLPARSGLGSSSSFTVGLLNALGTLKGQVQSQRQLAQEAIRIEQNVIQEHVGSQDQIWAAFGGTNLIRFKRDGDFDCSPVVMPSTRYKELNSHMMLFFTGFSRIAANIAAKKIENISIKETHFKALSDIVEEAVCVLQNKQCDMKLIGQMLHTSWELKRGLADTVTNSHIDEIYQAGIEAGALGGKLLGAGGGGFMMFFVPPELQNKVRQKLNKLVEVDFKIGSCGSKVVVYEPSGLENI